MKTFATGNSIFDSPRFLVVDCYGNIAVTDNHRVVILSKEGELVYQFGGYGGSGNQFSFPYGITMDDQGNLLVADSRNRRISIFG